MKLLADKQKVEYYLQGSIFVLKYFRYINPNLFDVSVCISQHSDIFVTFLLKKSSINEKLVDKVTQLFDKKYPKI